MADLLAMGERWLAGTHAEWVSTPATYARGALATTVSLTLGADVPAPLGNSPVPAVARSGFFPAAELVLGDALTVPIAGDLVTWAESGSIEPRRLVLGPWGPSRAVYRRIEDGTTLRVYGQEPAVLSGRKTATVEMQRPKPGATQNEFGEISGNKWQSLEAGVAAEVTPLSAAEEEQADRLQQLSKYLVFVATTWPVTSTWRLKVQGGDLNGRYLYVESRTFLPGYDGELMLVCRLAKA